MDPRRGGLESKGNGARGQPPAGPPMGSDPPGKGPAQPMELEHLIGYTGQHYDSVKFHPQEDDTYVFTVGAVLAIAKVKDPRQQRFLRGHDAAVCAFCISPCGRFVASGQVASKRYKGSMAPIIVWNWNGSYRGQFPGLTGSVVSLAFSPDSRYLAASGANNMFYIWDLESGEVLVAKRQEKLVTSLAWGPMSRGRSRRNPTYSLVTTPSPVVQYHLLEFETKSMRYELKTYPCQFPSRGLKRNYRSTVFDASGEATIGGTEVGDLIIFNMRSTVFRTRIPICAKGISSLIQAKGDIIYVGGGDGTIKKLQGRDRQWKILGEAKLPGRIVSLSLNGKQNSLAAGISTGMIYVVDVETLQYKLASESHTTTITDVSFGEGSTVFATISEDRSLRLWDLARYRVLCQINGPCGGRRVLLDDKKGQVVSGWADGSIRCYDVKSGGRQLWSIPQAHKGAITCLNFGQKNLISGGEDGSVRIWSIPACRLITQYQAHRGPVGEVLADVASGHLVHSFGTSDKCISTWNAKRSQMTIAHMIQNGAFSSMTQREDSEQELITGLSHGYLLFWDCDEKNPVGSVLDAGRSRITCMSLSRDNKYLAVSGADYSVRVYDVKTMKVVARCQGHASPVLRLSFSPDKKQIVSVGTDAAVCIWNFYA